MSQHDYNVANGGGAAVRGDINNALQAILTSNSGTSAPSVTAPFMLWFDTANGILKQRNAANTGWETAGPGRLVGVQLLTASGTYTRTPGATWGIAELVGGGGGSGGTAATSSTQYSYGSGGATGGYMKVRIGQLPVNCPYTIGAGGNAGTSGGAGGSGGATLFGSTSADAHFCQANGGSGGYAGRLWAESAMPLITSAGVVSGGVNLTVGSSVTILSRITGQYRGVMYIANDGTTTNADSYGTNVHTPLGRYGLGADPLFAYPSSAAANGSAGSAGAIIIYEYA